MKHLGDYSIIFKGEKKTMFNKYADVLSKTAKIFGVLGIIGALFLGISIWGAERVFSDYTALDIMLEPIFEDGVSEFLIGLLVMVISAAQSCLIYAFGEVMDAVRDTNDSMMKLNSNKTNPYGTKSTLSLENIKRINEIENLLKDGLITKEQYYQMIEKCNKR